MKQDQGRVLERIMAASMNQTSNLPFHLTRRRLAIILILFIALFFLSLVVPSALSNTFSTNGTSLFPFLRQAALKKPPSKQELGSSSWTLIHTFAAKYPDEPTEEEQRLAYGFVKSLTKLYPCEECAKHFEKFVSLHPPK